MFRFASKVYEKLKGFFSKLYDRIFNKNAISPQIAGAHVTLLEFLTSTVQEGIPVVSVISTYVDWLRYYPASEILDVSYKGAVCRYQGVPYTVARDVYMGAESSKLRRNSIGNTARKRLFGRSYVRVYD